MDMRNMDLTDPMIAAALTELDIHLGSDAIAAKAGLSASGRPDAYGLHHAYSFRVADEPDAVYMLSGDGAVRRRKLADGRTESVRWVLGKRERAFRTDVPL